MIERKHLEIREVILETLILKNAEREDSAGNFGVLIDYHMK